MIKEYIAFVEDTTGEADVMVSGGITKEEIIRCRDCKHVILAPAGAHCGYRIGVRSAYGYCDEGERKDND